MLSLRELNVMGLQLIAPLLESYAGPAFAMKEVDCWCTGDRTCRSTAEMAPA